ncbi:VOC family protein [Sphingomonas profundi]|uniref:VOC family protein n=1 Tax=Alterirhizorhabdus profundi TaxID=2681549 RepID=UPI0012E782A0|nr:VOC family protein [Sphingomonas profundi]
MRLNQVTVGCLDYDASCAFYTALGLRRIVHTPPRYARFETPTGETFSIHAMDMAASTTTIYFECDNLDDRVASLMAAGLIFDQLPRDESWLWREARLLDPAGNRICLYHAGENRRFPPWRVE